MAGRAICCVGRGMQGGAENSASHGILPSRPQSLDTEQSKEGTGWGATGGSAAMSPLANPGGLVLHRTPQCIARYLETRSLASFIIERGQPTVTPIGSISSNLPTLPPLGTA
jgi:hypothetical protein